MTPISSLVGVLVLAVVLLTNYFRAAWKLGILKAFGRRKDVSWRTLAAASLAGCLPFLGCMVAMVMLPSPVAGEVPDNAAILALQLAASGLLMHLINDKLMWWGAPVRIKP
ncbi:hypothetical protein [Aquabacterium sp.]|uniref:hypothetical protein n=1 Tax=Aquabacterium sp. TaxID=1872578 RepID=UPI0035B4F018